ncbi:pacifastin light chain precursor [Penaeus vannamei]|uniref:Pacifastin light chain n=1 Tax=Penaeus vannamei TaxID=6689 RepID=A0A423TBV9_PENVA|nr:pacifastin light chain precursor [Penaeus vannamei]
MGRSGSSTATPVCALTREHVAHGRLVMFHGQQNCPLMQCANPGHSGKKNATRVGVPTLGGRVACTVKACIGTTENADEPKCTDGSKWKRDDCNWCDCVEGKIRCTQRVCGHPTPQIRQFEEKEEMCTEGSRWRVSCNWCSCMNGTGGCTKKGCPPDFEERTDAPECEGTSRWKKDCNWCNCHNGRGICTTRACISTPAVHSQPTVEVTVTQEEPECTEGSRWLQSCNSCRCIEGKAACSKRRCIPDFEPSPDEPVCHGNSSWRVDCNWCNCANGKAICTYKACGVQRPQAPPVAVTVTREEGATCTEGSHWRLDCNWCRCIKGQGACTKRGCSADEAPGPDDPVCEGTSSWKRDCNWCNCEDGKAVCTEMACDLEGRSFGSVGVQENPTPKPCINGTTCTRRFCRHPPVNPICNLPSVYPDVDRCRGFESLWTFDSYEGRCVAIVYGGCGGTENLFETKAACEAKCTRAAQGSLRSAGSQEDKCQLKLESGPCFGLFYRYGYNSANGRCEQFIFGGCGGNANNFETAQECQEQCGGGVPVSDSSCDRTKCPWKRWAHYLVKNCIPQYEDGACCPTSFSCPPSDSVIPDPTKCYYRGNFYENGEEVPVEDVCSASCRCHAETAPQIHCANIECPSLFRPPRPGCRLLFSPDQCCSTDEECRMYFLDPAAPPDLETRAVGCSWGNKTYQIGDKMYFDDFQCQSCVCTPEFTSPTGPGCSKIDCGFEFRYTSRLADGCVPIFFEDKFVPLTGCVLETVASHQLMQYSSNKEFHHRKKDDQCHLGELTISHGSKLNINNCRIDCRCTTPPELTCVQYRSCELAAEVTQPKDCPEVNCPPACQTITDVATGCPVCSCTKYTFSCEKKECPSGCRTDFDSKTGCLTCKYYTGRAPCPMDCAIRYVTDPETGCEKCECDPANPGHPFGLPLVQIAQRSIRKTPMPHGLCIRYVTDPETGC